MDLTERKAKLYQAIVKHVLQHSHRRNSSTKTSKLKETDYEEILAEIGKVALVGLLKGDLLFEFGQLPEKVRGEEGVIVGLFQFSEYGPSLAPMEMVSFIHKSIQEYLAAWYLIYSCVPEGNLGEIGQHAVHLEDCKALENVFQFVCGLADEGAVKVLQHLTSVRISDPTLDLSKTIPDVESELVMPLCDVTGRHERFSNLVYNSFQQVPSTAELLSHFLDCTGGVILVPRDRPLSELMTNVTKLAQNCVFSFISSDILEAADMMTDRRKFLTLHDLSSYDSVLYKSLELLNCLQMPLRITDSSEVITFEDFIRKFHGQASLFVHSCCSISSILCFHKGKFQFYITELFLRCDDHARLFTESTTISVPCDAASLCSQRSSLKFLISLRCHGLSGRTVKALGTAIGKCKHVSRIEVLNCYDSMCYLFQQVQNPSQCSVTIGASSDYYDVGTYICLTSPEAVQLASLLPRFDHVTSLVLDLRDCCAAALDTLVASITHKTLKKLILQTINLTPASTKALGRSLPEMSSLEVLALTGVDGSILQAEDMEALFGGLNKTLALIRLRFNNFNSRGCLASLCKCFHFFPMLKELELDRLNMNEHDQCSLLENLRFIRSPSRLRVCIENTGTEGLTLSFFANTIQLRQISPAVTGALGRLLPEMSSLQQLELFGEHGSILQAEDMVALFGGLKKATPLCLLAFTDFNARGCLAPLFRSFRFFPNLVHLNLKRLGLDEHDLHGLLESFQFIPNLQILDLSGNLLGHAVRSIVPHATNLPKLRSLWIKGTSHSVEDLKYVEETVLQALPGVKVYR